MNSHPPNRATTTSEAYDVCNPEPLINSYLDQFYVDLSPIRNTEAIKNITTRLERLKPGQFPSVLFTGHQGCGKSTELRKIQRQLASKYYVIYLQANLELDINDAEYTDLYLLIIKKVTDELSKIGSQFDQKLLKDFEDWFKDITQENEESVEKSITSSSEAEIGFKIPFLSKLLAKLLAQIKGAKKEKKIIRQTLQKDISRLQGDINFLLKDASKKLKEKYPQYENGFLVIFDNLDRSPPSVGEHLFFDYAAQLQELQTTIIYTVPNSMVYSDKNINDTFGNSNIMPMVNLYNFERDANDLSYNEDKVTRFAELIKKRVDIDAVFESPVSVDDLVKASGGHVRQLMQMTADACLTADSRNHIQVKSEDVTYAIKQVQFNSERRLVNEDYSVLAKVCLTKNINHDQIGQKLLYNLSILEYNGERRWNYINPVLKSSELFQKALQNEQGQSGNT